MHWCEQLHLLKIDGHQSATWPGVGQAKVEVVHFKDLGIIHYQLADARQDVLDDVQAVHLLQDNNRRQEELNVLEG